MNPQPQNVLDYPGENTIFLVWNFKRNQEIGALFQRICALVINLNHSGEIRFPFSAASCVMGIGYDAWRRLGLPAPLPKELANFAPIVGGKHTAVATRGDLHFHLKGATRGICLDMAAALVQLLEPVAESAEEVHGFRYWDGRSILGFVDGTENPEGEKRAFFGLIGDDDPAYKGGSYVFVQKYIHDLKAFKALSVEDQEKVFGRYKENDVEMPDSVKPANSHSALANVGDDFKVIRDNMPFGNMSTNEMGTYFIAYASTFSTVKKMLDAMFIGSPEGNYDRLLDFSIPMSGSLFFAPSVSFMKRVADGDLAVEVVSSAAPIAAGGGNGSLLIGSLKKESGYE